MCKSVALFFLLLPAVFTLPTQDDLMQELGDDTAVVESTVREARAIVPEHIEDLLQPGVKEAFLHTYGDKEDADGDVQGYRKKTQDKGSDGYNHFDSYHKKDGDKYGYEIHSEYGKSDKASAGNTGKSGKHSDGDGGSETKKAYKVVENVNEGKKGVSAVEDYDGDSGYYADSGDSEGYTDGESENYSEGEGESGGYVEGGDSESEYYGGYDEGDGDSGHYTEDGDDGAEYSEAETEDDDDY
ncbi:keratin, type I cytoskeletal 9-like [Tribolium madens]|uniref:keratin, type I cytoskeletal 9-like n=1 Tax=Tribolium madens TaxID=41895 RepID=UPI001CF74F69|nr:keratin, type I cytoskeletal 9-like [Tribolium madens]